MLLIVAAVPRVSECQHLQWGKTSSLDEENNSLLLPKAFLSYFILTQKVVIFVIYSTQYFLVIIKHLV